MRGPVCSGNTFALDRFAWAAVAFFAASALSVPAFPQDAVLSAEGGTTEVLRVCADPNNMPYSNRAEEGFENEIAELLADALGRELEYAWQPQRRGFLRQTLYADVCDVVIGTPHLEMIDTTRTYYRSGYVFVSRADEDLDFSSIDAPELRTLRVGVHLIGDDGSNVPPAHALGQRGIVDNVVGYPIYGDYREASPPSRLLDAVVNGRIDVAAVWGPLAGPYVKSSSASLRMVPISDTMGYLPLMFEFPIAMGVRDGDEALRSDLNQFIVNYEEEIADVLKRHGVPKF